MLIEKVYIWEDLSAMKKKVLYLLLSASMILALAGCGAKEESSAPAAQEPEVVVEETKEEVVAKESELTVEELDSMIKEEFNNGDSNHNRDQVKEWCNQAIEMGSGYALYVMSSEYFMDEDYQKALELAQAAIDKNEQGGYVMMAYCYQNGLGVEKDINKTIELANNAIENDIFWGYAKLGDLYSGNIDGVERDEAKMFENYKAYCDLEKEDISYSYYAGLANCYFFGTGVEKDIDKGIEWATKAADGDDLDATVLLAGLYYGGNFLPSVYDSVVVPVDYDKALSYFEKAAELGHNDSSWVLARTYLEGINIFTGEKNICDIDNKNALKHYEEIINSGKDISAYNEKNIYLYAGLAAYKSEDYKKAREYSEKSIEVGEPKSDTAQSNLNILDEKGL